MYLQLIRLLTYFKPVCPMLSLVHSPTWKSTALFARIPMPLLDLPAQVCCLYVFLSAFSATEYKHVFLQAQEHATKL